MCRPLLARLPSFPSQVVIYLPADQLSGVDHLGQLASVYVNEGKWGQRQRYFREGLGFTALRCLSLHCSAVRQCLSGNRQLSCASDCTCSVKHTPSARPRPAIPAGFNVGSFRLRLGSGSGSAYVFNMTANSLALQTQR